MMDEGKPWLTEVFEQTKGGELEDLNQIMDHDIYKNNSAAGQSEFQVRNLIWWACKEAWVCRRTDTRFLIGQFSSVCNKILPDRLSEQALQNLLLEDPPYFHDLTYDEIVQAAAHLAGVRNGACNQGLPFPSRID